MADSNILSDFGIKILEQEIDDVIFQTNEFLCDATFTGSQGPFWWILQMCMALLLFDIVLCIQVENLTAITESEQTMAAYLQNSFFSAGYLMAASIVALKCLNLVPDLAAWMIPEGDTAFSTRNFGEGVAQQAKISTQGMISKVM